MSSPTSLNPAASNGRPRVLVTGATGFVGRPTCEAFLAAGWRVRAALRAPESAARLVPTCESTVVGDMTASPCWLDALVDVDAVVHLAARVHVMREHSEDVEALYQRANVVTTKALAEAAASFGVHRFVYVSSVKAVAEQAITPLRESDVPAPQDAYGRSKRDAEVALRAIASVTGLEVAILRPPLVYGPAVAGNFRRLLNLLRVATRLPLPLAGGGRRSLVYVENLASAIVAAASDPRAGGKTFFVRDDRDVTTEELLRRLGAAVGVRPRLFTLPRSLVRTLAQLSGKRAEFDRLLGAFQVDSSLLRDTLDWRPPVSVEEGLAATARSLWTDAA